MLTTGRCTQWQSRFLRYIDTRPNGDALRKCILEGPYKLITIIILVVPATDDSLEVPERTAVETLLNMSPENKEHYQSEKEAIHLLMTGIGDEIYSTVDACKTAHDMWIAIERLNNLIVATMQVNVQFLQQLQPEWSRFEVNEIRAERIATNANPLALVVAAQQYPDPYYQAPKSHKSHAPSSKQSSSTRSNASTKYKGKEIVKPITPPSESAFEEDNDPEQTQRDKDMQKNLALIAKYFKKIYKPTNNNVKTSSKSRNKNVDTSPRYKNDNQTMQFGNKRTVTIAGARETVGSQVVQQTRIQCFNCKDSGHFAKECRKSKRAKDYTYHKEKMLMCKQAEKVEEVDSNVIPDSLDLCNNDIQTDQNAEDCDDERTDQNAEECDDERVALANLIANLTLDTKENKKILKQLKKANASLNQELKECKSNLEESNTTQDSCLIALQNK
ncbi:retrovirus-related pol polyprotein from transposon TNT 1-94 [Tanacetum coccineum]